MSDVITLFQDADGNSRANMNAKFAEANAEFALEIAHRQSTSNPHGTTATQVGALPATNDLILASSDTTLTVDQSGGLIAITAASKTITLPSPSGHAMFDFTANYDFTLTTPTGVIYGDGISASASVLFVAGSKFRVIGDGTQYLVFSSNFAANPMPISFVGLRNQVIILKTDPVPTGNPDGTIIVRYVP